MVNFAGDKSHSLDALSPPLFLHKESLVVFVVLFCSSFNSYYMHLHLEEIDRCATEWYVACHREIW